MGYLYLALAISLELIAQPALNIPKDLPNCTRRLQRLPLTVYAFIYFPNAFIPAFKHCVCNMVRHRHCSVNRYQFFFSMALSPAGYFAIALIVQAL